MEELERRTFTMKGLVLLALFATGCAAAARRRSPEDQAPPDPDDPAQPLEPVLLTQRTTLRFQVDADSELAEDARIAARSWSQATGRTITATPDGDIPILLVDALSESCDTAHHPQARGCAHVATEGAWIEVLSSLHPDYRYGTVLHEMGHHLRGDPGHVERVDAVMNANRQLTVYLLTPEDIAFVCGGSGFSCASAS